MKSKLPEKVSNIQFSGHLFNTLIDHLTDYEAEQDRRHKDLEDEITAIRGDFDRGFKELDNRIQTIANNQLEMRRGETTSGTVTLEMLQPVHRGEQPKRWRADANGVFWYITHWGDITQSKEFYEEDTQFRYDIGNYFRTEAEAIAYKARLLELGKEI